jgi:hypothetical protein
MATSAKKLRPENDYASEGQQHIRKPDSSEKTPHKYKTVTDKGYIKKWTYIARKQNIQLTKKQHVQRT